MGFLQASATRISPCTNIALEPETQNNQNCNFGWSRVLNATNATIS